MAHGRDIICFSSIDWDFIWQGHQQIMTTLAARGNRVLFIENTGVRAPRLRDLGRLGARLRNWRRGTKGFREERANVFICSPLILPFPYSRIAGVINRAVLMRALRRWMRATGFRRPVVWTFLPTPLTRALIGALDPELTVYYCIDDLASSSPQARRIRPSENELFREADLVFVTSERLRERAARFSSRVHLFPFGVDFGEFDRVRTSEDQVPADLGALPRPIVGYVGGLHQWVDQDLLATVAGRLPDSSFVFIGPEQDEVTRLARCENVHLLGARSHEEVPRYIKGFDVGLVPYRIAEYTANVYPTKLNEYLAMGIPVVATDLPEIRRLNAEYGDVVATAPTPEAFATAITAAVADRSEARRARRIEVARENGWEARVSRMWALVDGALARRQMAAESWDVVLRRLYRTARRRLFRAAAAAALVYLLLFETPLLWLAAAPLRVVEPARPADAIVVFAGGVGESGKAGGGYQERVKRAVDLYHAGLAPGMVFSSGYAFAFKEAEIMKELAVGEGVPPAAIVLETLAANTRGNVVNVEAILRERGWRRVLLVSSPYHMRRALLVWRKLAPEVAVIATPPADTQFYAHGRGATLAQMTGIAHEYAAIVAYWLWGWI